MNRLIEPALISLQKLDLKDPDQIHLSSGLPLFVFEDSEQEVLKIELLFKAGAREHSCFILGHAVNSLLEEGTKTLSAFEIAERVESCGASIQVECTSDFASVSLFTLNKHFEKLLPILFEVITEPAFEQDELQTWKEHSIQDLEVNNQKVGYVSRKIFNKQLFGQHTSYGYYPSAADFEINRPMLTEFHQNHYLNGLFGIVISGNANGNAIKLIENTFSGIPYCTNQAGKNKTNSPEIATRTDINWENAVQTSIKTGRIFFDRHHRDFISLSILNTVFGGYFGSRLMSNLRERNGFTYGVHSSLIPLEGTGYLCISTEVGKNTRNQAIEEIFNEMKLLREQEIPDKELELVRNYLIGNLQRSLDGVFEKSTRFRNLLVQHSDFKYLHSYFDRIQSIRVEELKVLAEQYFDNEKFSVVLVG